VRVVTAAIRVDAAALEELLALQRHAIEHLDSPAFLRADERFHMELLAASGNQSAIEAAERAWLHVNRARYTVPMTVTQMRAALRGHREIAAAVEQGDAWRAANAIRAHIEEPLRRQLRWLAEREARPPVPPVIPAAAHWGSLIRP
jgi:DNA-binding GntR family transcriptional regulator